MKVRRQAWISLMFFIVAAVGQTAASAGTFPGANGKIAFASEGYIRVINADGTGRATLDAASGASNIAEPAWNATGTKLAYRNGGSEIRSINADGTNSKALFPFGMPSSVGNPTWSADGSKVAFDGFIGGPAGESRIYTVPAAGGTATELVALDALDPSYSPDGTKIAYEDGFENSDIGVMNADGSGAANITTGDGGNSSDFVPSWSPDGTKIAFKRAHQIWTMNADGSGAIQLTTGANASYPTWSPDGTKIAFERDADIWAMDSDGSDVVNITNTADEEDRAPDWGICTGSGCPPQVNAPSDRSLPEPADGERLRVALRISLSKAATQPVTVQWAYSDGTATIAGGDYEAAITSGSITIPAGQTSSGDLPYSFVRGDDITEQDETYTLELSGASNASIADSQTVITILGIAPVCPGFENVPGTHIVGTDRRDDKLEGTDGADVICGLGGNDEIRGGNGSDVLVGGPGDDKLFGHGGGDWFDPDDGAHDTLYGGVGNDTLFGSGTLYGGVGNDTLFGRDTHDTLYGEKGNDRLNGGVGTDTLDGGSGDDWLHGQPDYMKIQGPFGEDTVEVSAGDVLIGGGGFDTATYQSSGWTIGPGSGSGLIQVRLDDVANDGVKATYYTDEGGVEVVPTDNVHADVEAVIGSDLAKNRLVGNDNANNLIGGKRNDSISGGGGNDELKGGGGDDSLVGQDGDDSLRGGEGDDSLRGGRGFDDFDGGPGRDACDEGKGERAKDCELKLRRKA